MRSVQHVGRVVEHVYGGDGLTIACQVGPEYFILSFNMVSIDDF